MSISRAKGLKWRIMNHGLPEPFAWCCRVQVTQCGASLHHGSLLYHYSTQEGNISTYKRKPFTNADIFYCFPLCFFCQLLSFSYDTVIHLLLLSMTGGFSAAYCISRRPVMYKKKKIKFDRLNLKPEITHYIKTVKKKSIFSKEL